MGWDISEKGFKIVLSDSGRAGQMVRISDIDRASATFEKMLVCAEVKDARSATHQVGT
jgi:hypothetical protein